MGKQDLRGALMSPPGWGGLRRGPRESGIGFRGPGPLPTQRRRPGFQVQEEGLIPGVSPETGADTGRPPGDAL